MAFSVIDSYDVVFTHKLKRHVASSIYYFQEVPLNINIFLFHLMIVLYASLIRASNLDPVTSLQ